MAKDAAATSTHWKAFADRRRDPETKREAVLQIAAQLFLEKSYGRTSMNDVAERLHITKPALYHYFHNKEEILLECYRLGSGLIEEILNDISAQCGTGLEKVAAFIYSYANVMTVNFGRCVMGWMKATCRTMPLARSVTISAKSTAGCAHSYRKGSPTDRSRRAIRKSPRFRSPGP